ncbi:unnamed protein product [Closterium sp. NIES-65]|nr:unnamed protein product [Closterium sp. NIES-65]
MVPPLPHLSQLPYMRFGFNMRHIVGDSSPLHGPSLSDLLSHLLHSLTCYNHAPYHPVPPSQLPYMRFGFNLRHIVGDSSPLHGLSLSNLLAADASFSLTISGLERTTMQPVFVVKVSQCSQRESMGVKASPLHSLSLSDLLAADASFSLTISGLERSSRQPVFVVKEYYAYDGEVLWDYKFLHLLCAPCHLPLNHSLCPLHCTPLHSCSLHALHTAVFCTLLLHCRSTIAYEEYYAYDGEVLWDYEFLDLIRIASDLVPTLDHSRLDAVTPVNTHS